jgi:uncharacterized protein (TIGR02271 family)
MKPAVEASKRSRKADAGGWVEINTPQRSTTMRDTTNTMSSAMAIQRGWDVYGDDDAHLGTVEAVGSNYLLIQKGLFFTKDIYVPFSAVTTAADGVVRVNVAKSELESMGWDAPPTGSDAATYGTSAATTAGADLGTTERQRMALHEEELEARTTPRQKGEVEIGKHVVEDQQSIEVPVRREEVHVRRVPADRAAAVDDASFTEDRDTLRVPVMEEEVEVTKRPRVREEVEVEKVGQQDTRHVTDTVRREELDVSGTGKPDVRSSYGDSSYEDTATTDVTDDDRPRGI